MKKNMFITIVMMVLLCTINPIAVFGRNSEQQPHQSDGADDMAEKFTSEYNFNVGVGKVDITPTADPLPMLMGGSSPKPAESVSLPLYVKAAVISAGEHKIALVTVDILQYPSTQTDFAASQIERETGILAENVIISASHTHSGPLHNYYTDGLIGSIVEAVKEADKDLTPSKVGIAVTQVVGASRNRRLLVNGEVWNEWMIPAAHRSVLPAAGPIDPELQVLAAVTEDGKYKAILWNYAAHPTANNTPTISADYPGYVDKYVNEQLENDTMTLFLPGASGDINPGSMTSSIMGRIIANKLVASLENIDFIAKPTIRIDHRKIQIPGRENQAFAVDDISTKWPSTIEQRRQSFIRRLLSARATYETNFTGITIGDHFAIVTNPAEFFAAIGLDIKKNSPFNDTMVIQQTNGDVGYVPTAKDFELKGYETWYGDHSFLSVHADEMIKNESLSILRDLHAEQ